MILKMNFHGNRLIFLSKTVESFAISPFTVQTYKNIGVGLWL